MREILFRGRSIQTRLWYEGELINTKGKIPPYMPMIVTDEGSHDMYTVDVDPDTVGQYTGSTDKNGKKIFEGDLCLCNRHINDAFDKRVFEIKFEPERGFFGENFNEIEAGEFCMCEIIGNTHDNHELLTTA